MQSENEIKEVFEALNIHTGCFKTHVLYEMGHRIGQRLHPLRQNLSQLHDLKKNKQLRFN